MSEVTPPPVLHGTRRAPTIHDVAAALGMHKSTVSLGLSGKGNVSRETRARIEAVAKEMGYRPNPLAQRLATNQGNSLICLCAGNLDVGITTQKILLIQKELTRVGLEVPVYTLEDGGDGPPGKQAARLRHICQQGPRAIICSNQSMAAEILAELEAYQATGGIVISYDMAMPLNCDQVIFDRTENAYQTTRYLLDRGHRHLGLALSSLRQENGQPISTQNARVEGFRRALAEFGVPFHKEWLFEVHNYETGGKELAKEFLALPHRPSGLCIVNDYMALAFMVEVQAAGLKVPEDISIIGHDNQVVAAYCPVALTSATHPDIEIARAVSTLLRERLEDPGLEPRRVLVRSQIVERRSVQSLAGPR